MRCIDLWVLAFDCYFCATNSFFLTDKRWFQTWFRNLQGNRLTKWATSHVYKLSNQNLHKEILSPNHCGNIRCVITWCSYNLTYMVQILLPRESLCLYPTVISWNVFFFPTFTVVYILENKKIKEAKKWDIWTSFKMHGNTIPLKCTSKPKDALK